MPNLFSVEELVIDDSFYCYCLNITGDENVRSYWQRYAAENPSEKKNIDEARLIILGLRSMLQQNLSAAPPDYRPPLPASPVSFAINTFTIGCRLYAPRIAFIVIGFCMTSLFAVCSIPVLQSFTQPGVYRQAPAAGVHGITALKPLSAPAPGSSFTAIFSPGLYNTAWPALHTAMGNGILQSNRLFY